MYQPRSAFGVFLLLLACICLTGGQSASAQKPGDWPAFRGPNFDGHTTQPTLLSRTSGVKLETKWKKKLGSGYSSVVAVGDSIVTMFCDQESGYVICLSAMTGDEIWKYRIGPVFKGANGSFDGPITTPCIYQGKVFAMNPYGEFVALDLKNGTPLWSMNLNKDFKVQPGMYGFGTSPVVVNGAIVLQTGPPLGTLVAFDPKDGSRLWSVGKDTVAYQQPIVTSLNGTQSLVTAGNQQLIAANAKDGSLLWSVPHQGTGARGAMSLMPVLLDQNRFFLSHDDVKSKLLTISEGAKPGSPIDLWSTRDIRNSYNVPVVINNDVYAYSSRIMTCVDGETGKLLWRSRKPGDGFMSVMDNHLVLLTKTGSLHIAKPSLSSYEEVAAAELFEDVTWSVPCIQKNSIYVRSIGEIARVDVMPGSSTAPVLAEEQPVGPEFQQVLDRVTAARNPQSVADAFLKSQKSFPLIEGNLAYFVLQGDYKDVAVGGDLFGTRQERPLKKIAGTNMFYRAVKVPPKTRASYVFIADYKTMIDPRNTRKEKSTLLVEDIEMRILTGGETLDMSWFDMPDSERAPTPAKDKKLSGQFRVANLSSKVMKENIALGVYTPPGYKKTGTPYPVVFVHDGGSAEGSGKMVQIIDDLISQKKLKPTVAVFIRRPFNPMAGAPGYEQMFGKELLPLVERSLNVSKDRKDRSCTGGGFGATLALFATLNNRNEIGRFGGHSPFIFEIMFPLLDMGLATEGPACEVHIEWGMFDLTNPDENWDMGANSEKIAKYLGSKGQQATGKEVSMGTDWVCWRTRAEPMWKFLLGD